MKIEDSQAEVRIAFIPVLLIAILLLFSPSISAQETASNQNAKSAAANTTTTNEKSAKAMNASTPAAVPVFTDYKGIRIGMSADEVRSKLDHLKEKAKDQDYFAFSDSESAQVFYDAQGKVTALSVIYMGDDSGAPKPQAVLGEEIQTKPDGSMYELKRYPAAGYWVAYSRTAGKSPIITVTMQKMQ